MKIEIEVEAPQPEYPRLMIHEPSKIIVLFTGENEGICMDAGETLNKVVLYGTSWTSCRDSLFWKPFTGVIHISN